MSIPSKYLPEPFSPRNKTKNVVRFQPKPDDFRAQHRCIWLDQTIPSNVEKFVKPCRSCLTHHLENNTMPNLEFITETTVNNPIGIAKHLSELGVSLGAHSDCGRDDFGNRTHFSWFLYYCPVCQHVEQYTVHY
jgi:hypothetical protein